MIVHHLHHGRTACAMSGRHGTPPEWPDGHFWSANWQDVDCQSCIAKRDAAPRPALPTSASWVDRNPHPGAAPPKPTHEHPTEAMALNEWWAARHSWDVYVAKLRRHEVAVAVTELDRRGGNLDFDQVIARNIGACWLDGTLL